MDKREESERVAMSIMEETREQWEPILEETQASNIIFTLIVAAILLAIYVMTR